MRSKRINEAAPEVVGRNNNLVLFRATTSQHLARLPWFNDPETVEQYRDQLLPVYIVVKDKAPYVAVSTQHKIAQDVKNQAITPQTAQEIAPLFASVKTEFEGEAGSEFENGYPALQQAILGGSDGFGEEGGAVGVAEPPAEGVPASRLALGGPRPKGEPRGVNPLAGMREMTPGDVDAAISRAQGEQDPDRAKALRQQALSMMAQESKRRGKSRAQCWVEHLIK